MATTNKRKKVSFEVKHFVNEKIYCLCLRFGGVTIEARRCATINDALEMIGNYVQYNELSQKDVAVKINI